MANQIKLKRSSTTETIPTVAFGELVLTDVSNVLKLWGTDSANNATLMITEPPGGTTNFWRADGTWAAPAGSGNVNNTGTPVDGQLAVWTDATTIEGDANLTFDTTTDTLTIGASGNLAFGAVTVIDDAAGVTALNNIDSIDATTGSAIDAQIGSNYATSGHTHANLTAGTGLSGTTYDGSGASTFALDFSELTDMTASIAGTTEFILQDGTTESRKTANEIGLQFFDNSTSAFVTSSAVTYENLNTNGDIETDVSNDTASTVPSTQAVKSYVDAVAASEMTYKGGFDPTAAAGAGSPNLNSIASSVGDMYTVTAAGTYNFTTGADPVLEIGDVLICEATANPQSNGDNWTVVQKNLDGAVLDTRQLTPGVGILLDGANVAVDLSADRTISVDLDELTTVTDMDGATEYLVKVDAAGNTEKVLGNYLLDGGTFA